MGTDIRLETGDDAARENGDSAPQRRGGQGKGMLGESVLGGWGQAWQESVPEGTGLNWVCAPVSQRAAYKP